MFYFNVYKGCIDFYIGIMSKKVLILASPFDLGLTAYMKFLTV